MPLKKIKVKRDEIQIRFRKKKGWAEIMNLEGRHFLKLLDYTTQEIEYLLELSGKLKEKKKQGIPVDVLRGKNVALIFAKTSTRTRCAFEVAAHDLGMGTTYLDPGTPAYLANSSTNSCP